MHGKSIDEMTIGESAQFSKTISEFDVYQFAGVTGDFNPAHINEVYAAGTFFETRIAHGMLSAGLISAVIGNQLPGNGAIYIKQELNFKAPVRMGDTITARVEVAEINKDKNRVRLATTCSNQSGTIVLDGHAVVSPVKK
jgi:3-hydroxybutyryl-CoA dehydratase